ncbi:MAG: hypothetical protein OQK48_09835 [Sulfurimonas sp.]|uniref:LPS assembly lipoprotein LptE n=1 Tax=Sulfurimonas sp. TaxID=2022749 RepID=UPI002618BE6B|nr:LPS assembly lipoprotein LptE [Sulfurimonas sp.]MCW8895921.1 hypothetical protein [Sulfurimonas sp.]MCW8955226.1 hypothetical protein [Sulfurimonas sp.]
MKRLFYKFILLFLVVVTITACGYKPSAKFARASMGEKISTSVVISAVDPENTVIIKDAVDRAIIEVFQASLVAKSESDTHLILKMGNPSYSPIVYDENGFVIGYRMSVSLNITSVHNGESKNYSARGNHDFSVAPNAIVTDQERFEAIGFSTQRAIKSFIAQVSAEGARTNK